MLRHPNHFGFMLALLLAVSYWVVTSRPLVFANASISQVIQTVDRPQLPIKTAPVQVNIPLNSHSTVVESRFADRAPARRHSFPITSRAITTR